MFTPLTPEGHSAPPGIEFPSYNIPTPPIPQAVLGNVVYPEASNGPNDPSDESALPPPTWAGSNEDTPPTPPEEIDYAAAAEQALKVPGQVPLESAEAREERQQGLEDALRDIQDALRAYHREKVNPSDTPSAVILPFRRPEQEPPEDPQQ
jgi:hypothetical protein